MSSPQLVISDAAVRRAVLDAAQSWMLQAPAGSGKTELLMQRYLACLATVEQPESVLAITFTRKAAAEMRNRILAALEQARRFTEEELAALESHKRSAMELAQAALAASDALGWRILEQPTRLQIRTLDSFCESVAQRAPFKGLLGGTAQIAEDATPLYELAALRVLQQLAQPDARGTAVASLLQHLDNNVAQARSLLSGMLARREQWLHFLGRSDALDPAQQLELRRRLESALALSVNEELAAVDEVLRSALHEDAGAEIVQLVLYCANQLHEPGSEVIPALAAVGADVRWPRADAAELSSWRAIADLLLTGDGDIRKTVNVKNGFPVNDDGERQWKSRCVTVLKVLAALPQSAQLSSALARVRQLPAPRYTESQWQFMLAMLQLLPLAAAHLKVAFAEQGSVDFAEYAQRAIAAIGEGGDPTELGLQLGYRIRHVLVDEFQDTNRAQIELLSRLLHTWQADEATSTFLVGDPMQSIYAFRQADVAIYQRARRQGIGGHAHRFERLTQNFRSQRALVEWFNQVFPQILNDESDLTNAVRYAPAVASREALAGDAVHVRGFAAGDHSAEAEHLAACIRRELHDAPDAPPSIAVLVRSRSHLPHLVEALRAAGIRYRAVKTDRLAERPLVRDLEALRRALDDPADRTAWLAVLRAPWCGFSLAHLFAVCRGDEDRTVWTLLEERAVMLSARGAQSLERVKQVLSEALSQRGRVSPRRLLEGAWLRLGGAACTSFATHANTARAEREQAARDAEAYFALLDEQSAAGRLRDPEAFARKLGELFAPPDASPGIHVEIMPIHQAKGLEWDVVFLPALNRRPQQDDKSLLYWRLRQRDGEELLLLGPMEAAGVKKKPVATIESYMRRLNSACAQEELKRLFYVAATRARRRLYLSAAVDAERKPQPSSMLGLLWPLPGMVEAFTASDAVPVEEATPASERTPRVLRRVPQDFALSALEAPLEWNAPARDAVQDEHEFAWVGELLPRVGVVAHSFLQRIAAEGLERWDEARVRSSSGAVGRALLAAGVVPADLKPGVARVTEALLNTLADARARWLLSPHEEHACEYALSGVVGGKVEHIRVDRTFVAEGVRWLVDYKITEQEGGDRARFIAMQVKKYRPDMQRYVRVLRLLHPRPIRCALYLPLLGEFCEVDVDVPGSGA